MERQVGQLGRLDAQIFEGFRFEVDLLIDEFPFDFIWRIEDLPPQKFVEVVSNGLLEY